MLSDSELTKAFGIGIHTLLAGGISCLIAVVPKYLPLNIFWNWGVGCCVIGFSICAAAVIIAFLNGFVNERKLDELIDRLSQEPLKSSDCRTCKYFHGLDDIHCAVHPYGKAFRDCKDYTSNETNS